MIRPADQWRCWSFRLQYCLVKERSRATPTLRYRPKYPNDQIQSVASTVLVWFDDLPSGPITRYIFLVRKIIFIVLVELAAHGQGYLWHLGSDKLSVIPG